MRRMIRQIKVPLIPLPLLLLLSALVQDSNAKVAEGHLKTREQWAFLTRFCFLSGEGKFQYKIEYEAKYGVQKLLLYYDTDDQWPAVYNTNKTCSQKLEVLSDPMRHQFINLSSQLSTHSGCEMRRPTGGEPSYFCRGERTFISSRQRWWFIAVSNCQSEKGIDLKYDFLMTNGPEENSWLYHFSADEMYILRTNICMLCAQLAVLFASVILAVELRNRGLFHTTYKLYMAALLLQTAGLVLLCAAYGRYSQDGMGLPKTKLFGRVLEASSDFTFLLLLLLCAKGYTITRGRLRQASAIKLTIFLFLYVTTWAVLFVYEQLFFDPGEVLYLYESPGGYGLMVLKLFGWAMFIYSTSFTIKHYPEKWSFYLPFSMFYTVWFLSAPMVIICSNYLIDKWVREKVVNGVEHGIAWAGQVFFLILTRPTAANKNFPFHVRTSQISIMEMQPNGTAGNNNLDHFSAHPYAPSAPRIVGERNSTPTELFVISGPQQIPSVNGAKPYIKQDASFPHQQNGSALDG